MGSPVSMIAALILLVGPAGCFGSDETRTESAATFTLRDSAGVEIVENSRSMWGPDEGWSVGAVPSLRVGEPDGDPAHLLFADQLYQVAGAMRLEDGRIFVLDEGSLEVRTYDPATGSRAVVDVGGSGPGEFRAFSGLARGRHSDLHLFDQQLRRISLFEGGMLTGQVHLSDADGRGMISLVGVTSLDDYILLPPVRFQPTSGTVVERREYPYLQATSDGSKVTDAPLEHWITVLEGSTGTGSPLFAPRALVGVAEDRLVEALVDTAGIRVRSVAGRLLREARWPGAAPAITDAAVEAFIDDNATSLAEAAAARELFLSTPGLVSDVAPVHDQLFVDPEQTIWLRRTVLVARGEPEVWDVVDLDGRYLGDLALPGRFQPTDAGPDWLLGVATDELGVEEVLMYSMVRGR